MDVIQRGLINLLKSAVTEQPLPLPEVFDLEAADRILRRADINSNCPRHLRAMYGFIILKTGKKVWKPFIGTIP